MEISTRKEGKAVVVSVKGRIDAVTAPEFEKKLVGLVAEGECNLLLNFRQLEYISSAGLRSILATGKSLQAKEGKMLIQQINSENKSPISISFHLIKPEFPA